MKFDFGVFLGPLKKNIFQVPFVTSSLQSVAKKDSFERRNCDILMIEL